MNKKYLMNKCHRMEILALSIALILSLTACNDKQNELLVFQGESQNWEGKYMQDSSEVWEKDGNYESSSENKLWLKYKGKDIESVGQFKYEYSTNLKGGSGEGQILNDAGVLLLKGSEEGSILRKNDSISVTVEWRGKKEIFEMNTAK